jgi:diadenosine tetraphosphatase ApaH/serine/threonine PP2A family protein phosphatase
MRVLTISDIHANLPALEAVLAAAPPYDAVWNLGDIVGYGGNPNEVVDVVRKLGGIVVRGNHDRACCGNLKFGGYLGLNPTARYAVDWTQKTLSKENANWLSRLPRGPLKPLGRKVACVHGSPRSEDEYMFFREDVINALNRRKARITFCGHTHWQAGWSLKGREATALKPDFQSSDCTEQFELQLHEKNRYLLNPGSVGQPRDGDWRAAFAIYDDARSSVTFFRVPYDVLAAQESIRRAGLPEVVANRLRGGQ